MIRALALAQLAVCLAACAPAPLVTEARTPLTIDAGATAWRPLVLPRVDALRPAAPPALTAPQVAEQFAELRRGMGQRSSDDLTAIAYWDAPNPALRWSELARNQVAAAHWAMPRSARALALVHAAIYDAALASWDAKAAYGRAAVTALDPGLAPRVSVGAVPGYPSEHAAIAYAAAEVLAGLIPVEKERLRLHAWGAAESRVAAGAALRLDIDAGKTLGEAVAAQVLARAKADGSDTLVTLPLTVPQGRWNTDYPAEAAAGQWKTWLLTSSADHRLAEPAPPESAAFRAAVAEAVAVAGALTEAQRELADGADPENAPLLRNDRARALLAAENPGTPRTAQVLALFHATLADATLCSWDTQYRVLRPRPSMVEGRLVPRQALPPHPAYPSGQAVVVGAATTFLADVFPDEAANLAERGRLTSLIGLYAGVNVREDCEAGLTLGQAVAADALTRARGYGLESTRR